MDNAYHRLVLMCAMLLMAAVARGEKTLSASARLIAADDHVRAGTPFTVGIHIRMPKGAHIYYQNPGDVGLPTRVQWKLPEGFEAGPVQWPVPARFSDPPLMSHGYADEVVFPVVITPPARLEGVPTVRLAARVDWLLCEKICVPGGADVSLELSVGNSPARPTGEADLLERYLARVPAEAMGWRCQFVEDASTIRLYVHPPNVSSLDQLKGFVFIPDVVDLVEPSAPQVWGMEDGNVFVLRLVKSSRRRPVGARLEGILREGDGYPALPAERFWRVTAEPVGVSIRSAVNR